MRVCYFGTYDPAFARNALLLAGLRAVGAEVVECRAPLWRGTSDKLAAARYGGLGLGRRIGLAWRSLLAQHRAIGDYDALVVGYAGQLDALLARRLARRGGRPVILDAFLSLVETVEDRGLARPGAARWRAARVLDRLACRQANRVLVDTAAHAAYFAQALGVAADRLAVVPMGAWPRASQARTGVGLVVLYFGGYIPLHGLEYVVDAAAHLRTMPDVSFTLVGDGQEYRPIRAQARTLGLTNVRFVREWLSEDELVARHVEQADVCLGVFGGSSKAARVVPAKVLLALAAGRATITRDSPAAREALVDGEHTLLCAAADGGALADAIVRLRDDAALRARLGAAGPPLVAARFAPEPLGRRLLAVIASARGG